MHGEGTVTRITRYQGAIIRDDHILLIKQTEHATGRSYWLLPGGGIEPNETPNMLGGIYQRRKTYVCSILDGEARAGYEPEAEYATAYSFTEVGWFDLRLPTNWNEQIVSDPITYPLLQRIQAALGYAVADEAPVG